MGITHRHAAPGSFLWAAGLHPIVFYPQNDTDFHLGTAGSGAVFPNGTDTTPFVAGYNLITGSGKMPTAPVFANVGFTFGYIDAAGSTSTVTFTVTGYNQFQEVVSEDIVIPTGAGTKRVQTTYAYSRLTSIVVVSATGMDAADTLEIGWVAGDDTKRVVLGLPFKITNANDQLACCKVGPVGATGTRRPVAGTDLTKHTFVINPSTGITGGETLECRFKPEAYF